MNVDERLSRSELILGDAVMQLLEQKKVIIFGTGGVGSWAAEALVRTGLKHITLVDNDNVSVSNINRQLPATVDTVGQLKVEVLKKHLLSVNPDAEITTYTIPYNEETSSTFNIENYDYVIDAIDSLQCKFHLIMHVTSLKGVKFFSSMGAALKLDPTKIKTAEFWKVEGCALARALRQRFKRMAMKPSRHFTCVYSDERCENRGTLKVLGGRWDEKKSNINGSLLQITGCFGFTLASLVINDIYNSVK